MEMTVNTTIKEYKTFASFQNVYKVYINYKKCLQDLKNKLLLHTYFKHLP